MAVAKRAHAYFLGPTSIVITIKAQKGAKKYVLTGELIKVSDMNTLVDS